MYCSKCAKEYDDSFKFCPACGESSLKAAEPCSSSIELRVPPSGPTSTPPPPPQPPLQQAPKDKPKSRKKFIAIAIVSASIIALLSLCAVFGTVLMKRYEAKAKEEANQFIQNAVKKDYESQYKQINPTSYDTMWLYLVCPSEEGGETKTDLPTTEAVLKENYTSGAGVLAGMFGGESPEGSQQNGEQPSAKVTSIDDKTFYVELDYKGASEPFPLFIKRQNGTYTVDLAATLAFNKPSMAKSTRQLVVNLLKNPTIENCDLAQKILDKARTLKPELELWLKRGPETTLGDTEKTEIKDAIEETNGFEELSTKVEKAREEITAKNTEPETTPSQTTPSSTQVPTPIDTAPSTPASAPQPKKKSTADLLWVSLDKAFGNRKGFGLQFDEAAGLATITRTYGADDLWDENDAVRKGYSLLVKFGMQAFKVPNVNRVEAVVVVPMTDSYGKTSNEMVVDLVITKEEFQKYDWKELEYQAISPQMQRSCIKYWIHPSVLTNTNPDKLFLEL